MTEINNNLRASRQAQQQQLQQQGLKEELQALQVQGRKPGSDKPQETAAEAQRLPGLGSGLNTERILEKIMRVESRRLKPIQEQKATTEKELQAFNLVNQSLKQIHDTVQKLKSASVWDGKIVESSNDKVVTATATLGAKPGKNTLVVDRLALNHQIASQGYEKQETQIGTGKFIITVGKGNPITVVIDESNNTLTGLKDAINTATKEVNATIIKTGNRKAPYQLVLTSQKTGSEGRIDLKVQLKGGTTPNFQNQVEAPSPWKGVGEAKKAEKAPGARPAGASTAIAQVIGEYNGDHDNKFTFTAVQSGTVGGDKQLQLRWQDEHGRSGTINLDALHYAPGKPIEFVDGLALIFSEGDVIVNDSFSFNARAERSNLVWWVPPADRKAAVSTPTAWQRQQSEAHGAPVIDGTYTGSEDQDFTLTVVGSGQIGTSRDLKVEWKNEEGQHGILDVGQGYEPGSPLGLTEGVTMTLKPGVLNMGQTATFHVTPEESSGRWWLPDKDRVIPSTITDVTNWTTPGAEKKGPQGFMPELPPGEAGPRVSTARVAIGGQYTGDEGKVYTFTVKRDGAIGTTKDLKIEWDDAKGHKGELTVGENYKPGQPLPFTDGLTVAFGTGRLFKDDSFTVRTRTSTIQPPQDALIHFGATELGGGLEVTSPTNELDNVIEGVHLNLVTTSDKPVTITVRGDTEAAFKTVKSFVDQFNELSTVIAALTKYDKDTDVSGPLLGNSDLANIQNTLNSLLIDPVAGLPKSHNMLMSLGIAFDEKGMLKLDESKLQEQIQKDFGVVADLFRNKGTTTNSNVAFVGMTDETHVSTDGYPVNIESPATQGSYETPPLQEPIVLTPANSHFMVNVNGRQSEELKLQPGRYSLGEYARMLQDAITNDKVVGQARVRVVEEGHRLKILSGRFGKTSSVNFVPAGESGQMGPGLMTGSTEVGTDVKGSIDGKAAQGTGQLLSAPAKSGPAAGLRLFVKLNESQLNPSGPEAAIKVTRGIAARASTYLNRIVNPLTGDMHRITKSLRDQVGDLDAQLKRMQDRINAKRSRLQDRFNRLESQMSSLKEQQAYMASQFANMGGGGALPGLPGK
ncbi:MAG TPA: flagellar filament capping protein FliD [bacterium]|nr:flagellar filament capping protein FliD [bacterium]